ncbi:hypothetical protein Pla108_12770 [Botrimarina colliarenosi]|uniref:Uncharacterized protein n=1 Tax=Botrimarina colliarenosi TaxID=2528001 RepID=A0A5C6ALH2_9BACT|nr:SpoIIIAH-like family protein [Botrimarina colliarenosi]TWU00328.1 hypothetical protein Pla108_12770 [Botrimarina colliarenosi]
MRFLFAIIGYTSVATVLAAALGVGYLWKTERLTDERMFRIVALIHGVETTEKLAPSTPIDGNTPPEEPSLAEERRLRELAMRNYEVRQESLQRGKTEFDHSLAQLIEQRDRIDDMATELRQRIDQVSTETVLEGVKNVVRDLKVAKPDKGKELLLRILNSGGSDPEERQKAMDEVIQLINVMPIDTWADILNRFEGAAELDQLHSLQEQQLEGGEKKRVLEEAMNQLGK